MCIFLKTENKRSVLFIKRLECCSCNAFFTLTDQNKQKRQIANFKNKRNVQEKYVLISCFCFLLSLFVYLFLFESFIFNAFYKYGILFIKDTFYHEVYIITSRVCSYSLSVIRSCLEYTYVLPVKIRRWK